MCDTDLREQFTGSKGCFAVNVHLRGCSQGGDADSDSCFNCLFVDLVLLNGSSISSSHLKNILQNNVLFSFALTFFREALVRS